MLWEKLKPTIHSKPRGMLSKKLFCIMTMLDLIWQQWPLKCSENWNLSFPFIQHTTQITSHLTTIFLDYSHNMLCGQWPAHATENNLHRWLQEAHGLKWQISGEARRLHTTDSKLYSDMIQQEWCAIRGLSYLNAKMFTSYIRFSHILLWKHLV
jgi:hypothetical protein